MITKQKNYVHAYMDSIEDIDKNNYAKLIDKHHNYLNNLIQKTGNENTARDIREKLKNNKEEYKNLEKNLLAFLKEKGNEDIYTKFCESLLDEFTNITVDKDNLFTEDFKINPEAILTYTDKITKLGKVKEKHYLTTIEKRIKKAETVKNDLLQDYKNSKNPYTLKIIKLIYSQMLDIRKLYNQLVKLNIKEVKKSDLEKQIDNRITINNNQEKIDAFKFFEDSIKKLYKTINKSGCVFRLEKRLREVIVYYIMNNVENLSVKFTTEMIEKGIKDVSAASKKVTFSKGLIDSQGKSTIGKLYRNVAKDISDKIVEQIGNDDYYINFGAKKVDNKIDFYIQINEKKDTGISFKSYDFTNKNPKIKGITLASTLNLLSLILGMNSIDKSYAFLNTIAPEGQNKNRKKALDTLERQAVYAAATGHLGGRELINNNKDKAEYLVIEDTNSKEIYIYAMSTIINNLRGYIFIDPNPFNLDNYNDYFINKYITSKSGDERNALAAMERNTILLIKLRQTKMHIGIKKEVLPQGNVTTV